MSKKQTASELSAPEHIAIIMDGNGRWAKQRGLPRIAGHRAGAESVRRTVETCKNLGVKYLTLYAFSSENWKRPESEVKALMQLLERFLKEKTKEMMKQNVRLNAIGRTDMLPEKTRIQLDKAIETTADNTALTLNLALSYGSREEIVDATKSIAQKVATGEISIDDIDNCTISDHLYTADQPDPDLLIRTSGELRLSNFLLWQLSYSEIVILDKFWPDFAESDLYDAVTHFHSRHRRFGAI
ncbi:isoprenyl transferase [Rubritalea profundi]|uniref:Isoprenyl transferase n=1 Tax=Rubritalea profundi TaxID=1658618 RepID=A0A2S7U0M3_9BACT|nr:isoprenyl transferase [Rubritalea profundi]PQJ27944.1 di-trans,poly-cis-decaprenylcistransferase [Rubritalea profundi]